MCHKYLVLTVRVSCMDPWCNISISKIVVFFKINSLELNLFEQNLIFLTKGCFLQSFVEIGTVVFGKKIKLYDINVDEQRTRIDQKSYFEPSAQVS